MSQIVRMYPPPNSEAPGASAPGSLRLGRRLLHLYVGLGLFGASLALMVNSSFGLDPWDVLHQGLAEQTGFRLGRIVILVGAVVLMLWLPLHERPGIGTLSNVVVVGLAVDAALTLLPNPRAFFVRAAFLTTGIVANGAATALYMGAGLGPGPRDGLMTGLARRGHSLRLMRTGIEVSVLAAGWLLGGTVGVGTILYAVSIGPLVHILLPKLQIVPRKESADG